MFCSSLRKRQDWAHLVPTLLRSSPTRWKETMLNTHDIAFPIIDPAGLHGVFKLVLLSTGELNSPEARSRVERLSMLSGGKHVAVILLLSGKDSMVAFSRFEMEMLGDNPVPIVPISSSQELSGCLSTLRQQISATGTRSEGFGGEGEAKWTGDLIHHCVRGKPLSRDQANVLTGMTTGLKDIAEHVSLPDSQVTLKDFLGEADAHRIISFFTEGPTSADG